MSMSSVYIGDDKEPLLVQIYRSEDNEFKAEVMKYD